MPEGEAAERKERETFKRMLHIFMHSSYFDLMKELVDFLSMIPAELLFS